MITKLAATEKSIRDHHNHTIPVKVKVDSMSWLPSCGGLGHVVFESNNHACNARNITTNTQRYFGRTPESELSDVSNTRRPLLSSRYTKTNHSTARSYGRRPFVGKLLCNIQGEPRDTADFDFEFLQENRYTPYSAPIQDVDTAWIDINMAESFTGNTCAASTSIKMTKGLTASSASPLARSRTISVPQPYCTSVLRGNNNGFGGGVGSCDRKRNTTSKHRQAAQQQRPPQLDKHHSTGTGNRIWPLSLHRRRHRHRHRHRRFVASMSSILEENEWQSAEDTKSGRTYYFNVKTLETQWRKPLELASESERAEMEAKERNQKEFFSVMEANILKSFAQGTIGTTRVELKKDPSARNEFRPGRLVRTISGMDEFVLKDLLQRSSSHQDGSRRPSLTLKSLGKANAQRNVLDPLQESAREDLSFEVSHNQSMSYFDSSFNGSFGEESSADGFGLSGKELRALQRLSKITEEMTSMHDSTLGNSSSAGFDFEPDDSFTFESDESDKDFRSSLTQPAKPIGRILISSIKEGEEFADATENAGPAIPARKPVNIMKPLTRHNTCGTMYVKSTMSQPDTDATIKCVCGVYRAHIVASSEDDEVDGGYSPNGDPHRIFNDRESQRRDRVDSDDDDELLLEELKLDNIERCIPSLEEIASFYRDVFRRAQMESDCIIMSLIYVERLIKDTGGQLRPRKSNWRSLLFASMILSSKVWDDLSMWNADFSQACPSTVVFSLKRINELELCVLGALRYKVKVPASEYAKYYFLLRSMLIKSGLGGEDMSSDMPLDIEGAKKLQELSAGFQSTAKKHVMASNMLRSKSMGEADKKQMMLGAQRHNPGRGAKLEHMVQM